jgi:hypothetical protein
MARDERDEDEKATGHSLRMMRARPASRQEGEKLPLSDRFA